LSYEIRCADALAALRGIADSSLDSLVTDPPAGIAFMGKDWDGAKGGRDSWIAWLSEIMLEVFRVMKPGAHGVVWALPRTSHWTATALEDAGFEIRDVIVHLFGTGFPKSLDVSKAIDAAAGAERRIVGEKQVSCGTGSEFGKATGTGHKGTIVFVTTAATDEAKRWEGWGTALKPAAEHWILIRKPLREKNVAANVLTHGTGAINIDGCRIVTAGEIVTAGLSKPENRAGEVGRNLGFTKNGVERFNEAQRASLERTNTLGRWPSNVVFSHHALCEVIGEVVLKVDDRSDVAGKRIGGFYDIGSPSGDGTPNGKVYGDQIVPVWDCVPGCSVAHLDAQTGILSSGNVSGRRPAGMGYAGSSVESDWSAYGDRGGASRFFYVAKPSNDEKQNALESISLFDSDPATKPAKNSHPTVKPVELMRYLIRLVTPPGGTVLDCFLGSGTTGVAAMAEDMDFIGIEREPDYASTAIERIRRAAIEHGRKSA